MARTLLFVMDHRQDYAWIAGVREALLAGDLREPPAWVRDRANALFQAREPRAAQSFIERVRATLIFDSRRPGLVQAGVRAIGQSVEGPWQLLYRGGDIDIDLLVRPNQDGRTLTLRGQALALGGSGMGAGVVEAMPLDAPRPPDGPALPSARSDVEPTGEFALPNLERGHYDVLVRFGAREIELSNVEL